MDDSPPPDSCDIACPYGVTIAGRVALVSESRGNPLRLFPSLLIEGRAYNLWLTGQILDPVLVRWNRDGFDEREPAATVASDIEWACERGRLAFQQILPVAGRLGDAAILAAMGVTANLERTLALLGEFILDDRPALCPRPPFHLSRFLCGLIDYPEGSPYFPGRVHPPVHAARLLTCRRDSRYLGNALWCSEDDIDRRCEEALAVLRQEIRRMGCFTPGDLRHLHTHHIPGRLT